MPPFREDLKSDRLVATEEEILRLWESEKTFERSLAARRDAKPFVFYEGPPTANGKPGLHHLLSRSVKDLACRLKTMQGFLVERKAGWDTHGLPVEIEAEKKLGLAGKDAIEKMGIAAFNQACRDSVFTYLAQWEEFTRRTGYWVDFSSAYVTCSNEYVESLWYLLADFHAKGLLFKGHKVLPYCPRCGTPLSSHEVGQGFRDVQDPSVFLSVLSVAADGKDREEPEGERASYLVWTTTPWTLPSNVALAVHPDVDYVKVRLTDAGGNTQVLWLAEARLSALKAKPEQIEVLEKVKGAALVGRRYRRLLDFYDLPPGSTSNAFTIRAATFVTTTDGSGIVHMAPAYGEDDAAVGRRDGLPTLHPVDAAGRFTAGPRAGLVEGKFVKDADKDILRHLKQEGLLFRQETIVHPYPHCWRCDTPLLYYARDSWYLRTTRFRDQMLANNASVAWYPEATGSGRMGQWLENNVDWAVSRDRYWGTPLPVWVCDDKACRREQAVGSLDALKQAAGRLPEPLDLHRPYVDELTWPCAKPGCKGTMRRTPEVMDCWFDSGSMPFAQWHYPFAPGSVERVARAHPADVIAEGVDQTRGWFYTLLAVSTMHRGTPAYRACVSNDMVLDAKGKKMSKSKGNMVDPMALVAKHGADVVRWLLLTSRPVWQAIRFDEADLVETRNRFFGTLASTYAFFAMYANADGFAVDAGRASPPKARANVFDRWITSRTQRLVRDVTADLAVYETSRAGKRISEFVVEDLSNWYVRRNRRRFWKGALSDDKGEAYETLHEVLVVVARLMAPMAPFFPDALHRALLGPGASVHLTDWPVADVTRLDDALEASMETLRTVVSLGHAARNKAGVKVRTPLREVRVVLPTWARRDGVPDFEEIVREELNVEGYASRADGAGRVRVALNKKDAARRLGAKTQPTADALAALGAAEAADLERRLSLARMRDPDATVELATAVGPVALACGDVLSAAEDAPGTVGAYERGVYVGLDPTVTPDLVAKGLSRELVRAAQNLRKSKGLKITDRIRLSFWAEGDLAAVVREHGAYIAGETLAVAAPSLNVGAPPADAETVDLDGLTARLALVLA